MVGENFENYLSEVTKIHLKSSTMVGEIFEKLSFSRLFIIFSNLSKFFSKCSCFSRFSRSLIHIPGFSRFLQVFQGTGHPERRKILNDRFFDVFMQNMGKHEEFIYLFINYKCMSMTTTWFQEWMTHLDTQIKRVYTLTICMCT